MLIKPFAIDQISVDSDGDRRNRAEEAIEQRLGDGPEFSAIATDNGAYYLNNVPESTQRERPRSAASHRSQNSTWRPIDQPNLPYVQTLLARLFNLRYSDSEILIMKRVYHQLDWRDRGYLYRTDVERCCIEALKETKFSFDHKALMKLVNSVDLNRDGEYCTASLLSRSTSDDHFSLEHYINCTP